MGKKDTPAPNTILGAVHWYADMHFGTLLWVCQATLGYGEPGHKDADFLNTKKHYVRDFFNEVELRNGMLGLELFADSDWRLTVLCEIETKIPYAESISDEDLLRLVEDFKEYVRSLPPAKSGDSALITDPANPLYYGEFNREWLLCVTEMHDTLNAAFEAAKIELHSEGVEVTDSVDGSDDEIPF